MCEPRERDVVGRGVVSLVGVLLYEYNIHAISDVACRLKLDSYLLADCSRTDGPSLLIRALRVSYDDNAWPLEARVWFPNSSNMMLSNSSRFIDLENLIIYAGTPAIITCDP